MCITQTHTSGFGTLPIKQETSVIWKHFHATLEFLTYHDVESGMLWPGNPFADGDFFATPGDNSPDAVYDRQNAAQRLAKHAATSVSTQPRPSDHLCDSSDSGTLVFPAWATMCTDSIGSNWRSEGSQSWSWCKEEAQEEIQEAKRV